MVSELRSVACLNNHPTTRRGDSKMKTQVHWKKQLLAAVVVAVLSAPNIAAAALEGENWAVSGRLKQGFALAYDLADDGTSLGPSNFLAEANLVATPTDTLLVKGRFWVRGDWYSRIGDDITAQGIQDFASPGFTDQFDFNLNDNAKANDCLCDFNDDIIRDLYVRYTDPKRRYSIKVGKFQRGWGQSDGIRLLDVLNAQDLRERSVLRDAEDLRIPAWTAAVDLKLSKLGMGKPFEAVGIKRPSLEFVFIPEVHHSRFIINNPTPSDRSSGGIFGFPFPELNDPVSGLGMPFVGANLSNETANNLSFKDAEFALRLSFEALDAQWTLNGFYGQQDLPVVKLTGADIVIGNARNNPSRALATVPLDLPTTLGAVHGPGGYVEFLRSLTTAPGSVPFPLSSIFGCADILIGAAPDCSVNLNFDLDYDYRQKLMGFSMTRDMRELRLGRKEVSPVLRTEMTYEFDKPFNSNRVATGFGRRESGSPALVTDPLEAIVKRDVWSTMIGMDYFLWIPFWDNQRKSMFTSVQFFNIYTEDSNDLLTQAPYGFVEVPKNQNFVTLLWNLELMQERIFIEGLSIFDIQNDGFIHRQRIDFNFFGDNIRPRFEWITASGDQGSVPAGTLRHSDIFEFSLAYQF